jgi:hypothetical protein
MTLGVKKSLALVAFILMTLSLVLTLVRPRLPGSQMSAAEMIAIPIQIFLAVVSFRLYRR